MKTFNTKSVFLIIFTFLFTSSASAGWNELVDDAIQTSKKACIWCDKSLIDLKEDFKEDVKTFDEQKVEVSTEFSETKTLIFSYASILKRSKNENLQFGKLHDKWEDTVVEVTSLESKFIQLVKSADTYFVEIEKRANSINDAKMQNDSFLKIKSKKKQYTTQLKQSRAGIERLRKTNIKVKDLIIFLEINFSLKSLDKELADRFSIIDDTVKSVMKDLDDLNKQSQVLLNEV